MRKLKLVLAFLLGTLVGGGVVRAVNFTVDLTTAEIATATWKWNQVDPLHTTYTTVNLYGQFSVKNMIAEWENQRIAAFAQQAAKCQMWNFLSPGEKSSVCTTIGEVSTCTIPGC